MSEESIKEQNNIELTIKDLEVIFDVLNVFDPNDISHVYPEMGENKFRMEVNETWKKVLELLRQDGKTDEDVISSDFTSDKKALHPDAKGGEKWEKNDFDVDMSQALWDN